MQCLAASSSPNRWLILTSHISRHPNTAQRISRAVSLSPQIQSEVVHDSRLFCRSAVTAMTKGESTSTTPPAASTKTKLRILCLHGYLQNSEVSQGVSCRCSQCEMSPEARTLCSVQVFSGKIGSMRKALKSRAEFIFMDAPHEAEGEEAEIRAAGGTGEHPKTWWLWEVHCWIPCFEKGGNHLSMGILLQQSVLGTV